MRKAGRKKTVAPLLFRYVSKAVRPGKGLSDLTQMALYLRADLLG